MGDELERSAGRLFVMHATAEMRRGAEAGRFPRALWDAVVEAGFTAALLPEGRGGFGATPVEALGLVRVAAGHAAPIPLAETMLAGFLLAGAGLPMPPGIISLAPVRRGEALALTRTGEGWRLSGRASRVPWGRDAAAIAAIVDGPEGPMLASIPSASFTAEAGHNLAREPRDTLIIDGPVAASPSPWPTAALRTAGAALRTNQIAGALHRLLALCVGYAQTRVQFGRPIGKFQAIQQNLAVLAGEVAAATAAADMAANALAAKALAAEALATGIDPLLIGAAKARASEAAGRAAAIAHQTHGAIGFTQEYELHELTRRLWSWRDEFGNEAEWNELVGRAALGAGADGLWPMIAA
jgi:acyl-CoA dehydrogenase